MSRPEKRWQLLLVADDGRIIPFRRIKGVAIALVVLVILLGLICIGLGWRLTVQNVNHAHTLAQLSAAREQAAHFKHEHELISAELVLAEARMEKAGLPVPRREEPPATAISTPTDDERAAAEKTAEGTRPSVTPPAPSPVPPESQASKDTTASPPVAAGVHPPDRKPAVSIENPVLEHDARKQTLKARFRIKNNGPSASPAKGRCVVVLHNGQPDPKTWISMPPVALTAGRPDGSQGQAFGISYFMDMEIMAPAPKDPSPYQSATLYVFDNTGGLLREDTFAVDLPAPRAPQPTPVKPSSAPSATAPQTISPSVAVENITVRYSAATKRIRARFRVRNTGSRRVPVAGRAVVVLGGGQVPTDRRLALPDVTLVDGKPDGRGGRTFRISRFVDMNLSVQSPKDPSVYQTATVYIFDRNGVRIVEQTAAADLPAPAPKTVTAPTPAETETPPPAETTEPAPQADTVTAMPSEAAGAPVTNDDNRNRF